MNVDCNGMAIRLKGDVAPFVPTLTCESGEAEGVFYVTLDLKAGAAALLPALHLVWDLPSIDVHYKWNSRCAEKRTLDSGAGTYNRVNSSANSGMPVYSLYAMDGINACTWALSDVIHESRMGGSYHNGHFFESEVILSGNSIGVVDSYSVTIRFDFRRKPYYEVLKDVSRYWETLPGLTPCTVPAAARKPLFCSWYICNLDIDPGDLEEQCEQAAAAGFDTLILDDGWQTSQRDFGYRNNGDWEVCDEKLPAFIDHVKKVQALGMQYMVWFAVPFVGVDAKAYRRFKDMLIPGREGATHFSLDLRYPVARDYLAGTYESFVRTYGVDGLKLDFIDSASAPPADLSVDPERDCVTMGEAICKLLDDVTSRLRKIKPNILLEFRQSYTGPAMRPYANIFRAIDCPNSLGDNRIRTLDLRLLAGDTAVHADPITWHKDEPVESAAMQLKHTLFAVPQISRRLSELNDRHRRMLTHHLAFIREHSEVLYRGELRPLHPEMLFPQVVARTDDKLLGAYYAHMSLTLEEEFPETVILVNGTYSPEVLLDLARDFGAVQVVITDCVGQEIENRTAMLRTGLHRLKVPPAGHIHIIRHP